MITMKEFFKNYNINCPEWLQFEMIEKEWLNSNYSNNNNIHEWKMNDTTISFDGETYRFYAVNPDNPTQIVENVITEDTILFS